MSRSRPHRKSIRHYHEPGHFHEFTFSCYHQMKLLANDTWRGYLARSIDDATANEGFQVLAFVFMPEHVHLIAYPTRPDADASSSSRFLAAVKRPVSIQVKSNLASSGSRLLQRLTVTERPGKTAFRFWQEGPGYDRNLQTEQAMMAAIDYIHLNPVRRGLVQRAIDWRWSSARWYVSDGQIVDETLPTVHSPPPELFSANG